MSQPRTFVANWQSSAHSNDASFTQRSTAFSLISFTSFFSSVWQTLSFQLSFIYSLWFYDLFHNLMIKSWVSSVINFGTILWITLDPSSFLSFFATRALRENCNYTSEFIFAFHQSSVIATALYLSYSLELQTFYYRAKHVFINQQAALSLPLWLREY